VPQRLACRTGCRQIIKGVDNMSVDIATATGKYLYAVVRVVDATAWQARAAGQIDGIDGASV